MILRISFDGNTIVNDTINLFKEQIFLISTLQKGYSLLRIIHQVGNHLEVLYEFDVYVGLKSPRRYHPYSRYSLDKDDYKHGYVHICRDFIHSEEDYVWWGDDED